MTHTQREVITRFSKYNFYIKKLEAIKKLMSSSKFLSLTLVCLVSCLFIISSCTPSTPVITVLAIDRSGSNVQPDVRRATSQIICEELLKKQENDNDMLIVFTFDSTTDSYPEPITGSANDDKKDDFKKTVCGNIKLSSVAKPGTKISEAFSRARSLVSQYQIKDSSAIVFISADAIEGDESKMTSLQKDANEFLIGQNNRLVFFISNQDSIDTINREPLLRKVFDSSIKRVYLGTFYDSKPDKKFENYDETLKEVDKEGRKAIIDDYFSSSRSPTSQKESAK